MDFFAILENYRYFFLIVLSVFFITNGAFIHGHFSNLSHLPEVMMAFIALVAWPSIVGPSVSIAMNMPELESLNRRLQTIVNNSKCENLKKIRSIFIEFCLFCLAEDTNEFDIYKKAEEKCRLNTIATFLLSMFNCTIFSFLPSILHSIICMSRGNYDTSTWFYALKITVPFDTSTVFGWYILLALEALFGVVLVSTITPVVTYFVNCCLYIRALCQHFEAAFHKLDAKILLSRTHRMSDANEIENELKELVLFHVKITE